MRWNLRTHTYMTALILAPNNRDGVIQMTELTTEQLLKWKETFAKDGIVDDSDEDYREAVNNLVGYFDILIQIELEQKRKKKNEPKSR